MVGDDLIRADSHFYSCACQALNLVIRFPSHSVKGKGKGLPQQAEVAQGVPGRLRPPIFLTLVTTRVVGRQTYAPAAFTPERNPWYSFLGAESTPGRMVLSVATEKIPNDTTGNRSRDRPTSSAVP